MNRAINRVGERGAFLLLDLVEWTVRHTGRTVGLAVVFHEIAERTGDPIRELVPAHGRALFESYLTLVQSHFRLVPASKLRSAALTRRRGERIPLAVTFDDDLSSHVREAAPILTRRGIPATFFLCSASGRRFWWEVLQAAVDRGIAIRDLLPHPIRPAGRELPSQIHVVARVIERMAPSEQAALERELRGRVGDLPSSGEICAEGVAALTGVGFEIGFHTLKHSRLPPLSDDELDRAMREGRDTLGSAFGRRVELIAYPHGVADGRVAAAARRAGYRAGFTTQPQALGSNTDPLVVPRIAPGFRSAEHFALRIAWALLRFWV